MCLRSCEDFAHNYVSNPNTGKCEYCGPTCTHCTLQYGCRKCHGSDYRQLAEPAFYMSYVEPESGLS